MPRLTGVILVLAALSAGAPSLAAPRSEAGRTWGEEKCARYGAAWQEAVRRFGTKGVSPDFIASHEAFLASGCTAGDVCPRSQEELDLANIMVIRAMNAGTASTFPPFRCRR